MSRDFNGDNADVLSIGDVAAADITGTAFSCAAWVRPNGSVTGSMIAKSSNVATDAYHMYLATNNITIDISDAGGADTAIGATDIPGSVWSHCAVVKQGTGAGALRVYYNGAEDASVTSNRSIQNAAAALTLGRRASADNAINGLLAECAIWAASLSVGELLALAKGLSPMFVRPQSLRGYWPLWGTGSPERDYTQWSNDATVTGTIPAGSLHPPMMPHAIPLGSYSMGGFVTVPMPTAPFPPLAKSMAALLRR